MRVESVLASHLQRRGMTMRVTNEQTTECGVRIARTESGSIWLEQLDPEGEFVKCILLLPSEVRVLQEVLASEDAPFYM
jgi:hypothetical protein